MRVFAVSSLLVVFGLGLGGCAMTPGDRADDEGSAAGASALTVHGVPTFLELNDKLGGRWSYDQGTAFFRSIEGIKVDVNVSDYQEGGSNGKGRAVFVIRRIAPLPAEIARPDFLSDVKYSRVVQTPAGTKLVPPVHLFDVQVVAVTPIDAEYQVLELEFQRSQVDGAAN